MNRRAVRALFFLAFVSLLLAGCAGPSPLVRPTPTMLAAAPSPVVADIASRPEPATFTPTPRTDLTPTYTPVPQPVQSVEIISSQEGLRPEEARFFRQSEPGLDATAEWRPPPLPVPLSLHPDDHYWLSRSIPSDKRNYDLEWFPYGNDVLLPELYPYRVHRGLDFPNKTGTPILAASSGTVVHAGVLRSGLDGVSYYGNTVIIHHDWQWRGQDVYTLYAHTMELFVKVGDYVEEGQLIAGVGRSGIVSGPHLHLEVRVGANSYEQTRNPMLWLAPYEGWGTLAGQFIDVDGNYIYAGWVGVRPINVDAPARGQYTYRIREVNPDDVWKENFVFGDLPAGQYEVTAIGAGHRYQTTVNVLPGRTNFVIFQTDFVYSPPTATPTVPGSEGEAPPAQELAP